MRYQIFNIIEIADEENKISIYYDRFMLISIILSIFPLCFKQSNMLFFLIDKATVSVFILDYILRWITADFKYKRGFFSFLKYPFTPFAIIDLLSILPSLNLISSGFKLFRLFRLGKVLRVLRVLRYSKSFNLIITVIKNEQRSLTAVCALAGGYVLSCALLMFQIEPNSFGNFFDAIYWSITTLTTVGYGDIYPTSEVGRFVSMISSFMGIAIVALPTGIITAGYMNELNKK